jgi:hypothetical protein
VKFGSVEGYVTEIGMETAIGYFHAALLGNGRGAAVRPRYR